MIGALLLLVIFAPYFIFQSEKGPGSLHAAIWLSLVVGLVVGVLAQRTRMCFVGGWRDLLLVKGAIDYVVRNGEIMATITEPDVSALEAIGGTGDTITGVGSVFAYAELEPHEAATIAARANRMAGKFAEPAPATGMLEIIRQLPVVYKQHLCQWSGVCYSEGGQQ
jgi:hypothetical protein